MLLQLLASGEIHCADGTLILQKLTSLLIRRNLFPCSVLDNLQKSDAEGLPLEVALLGLADQSGSTVCRHLWLHDVHCAQ